MRRRFHDADRRAVEFHLRLKQIEQMPLVWMEIGDDRKTVHLGDKNVRKKQSILTVDGILYLHPEEAVAKSGSYDDLMSTHRPPNKNRVPQVAVDEEVQNFLSGEDE